MAVVVVVVVVGGSWLLLFFFVFFWLSWDEWDDDGWGSGRGVAAEGGDFSVSFAEWRLCFSILFARTLCVVGPQPDRH